LSRLRSVFDPDGKLQEDTISDESTKKATLLCELLRARLRSPPYAKRLKLGRWKHWSLEWAMENLSIPAAYMVLFRQAKKDISCVGEGRSLLAKPTSNQFFLASNVEGKLFGCYLAFDENGEEWVRAGKATGEGGCVGRWAQHAKRAKADRNEPYSRFYDSFPSKESVRSKTGEKEGLWENLKQYVAMGFDGDAVAESGILTKDCADDGIFFYTQQQKEAILRLKIQGKSNVEKYSEMVAYLLEIAYDLAIATSHNVSDSTGFEACGLNL